MKNFLYYVQWGLFPILIFFSFYRNMKKGASLTYNHTISELKLYIREHKESFGKD